MKGFVIYPTYRIINNISYVVLYGRLENGKSFVTINEFKPYFFIRKSDINDAMHIADFKEEESNFTNKDKKAVMKVIVDNPTDVPKLRKKFKDNEIETYEADIKFAYRFLIDHEIKGSVEISGEYEPGESVDRIYKNPEMKGTDYFPSNLKIVSMDIESDKESGEIWCISLVCGNYKKVLINSKKKLNQAINCNNEEDILEKFIKEIIELDPDIITGWNVIDFDLMHIIDRCKKYKINFIIGRENSKCKIKIEDGFFRDSKAEVPGRQFLDTMGLLKTSFIKVKDYKLDTVATEILKDNKLIQLTGLEKYKEIKRLFEEDQQKLVDYNLKDSELVLKILEKTKIMELSVLRSIITGMPLDRVSASVASLDSLYLRESRKRSIVLHTNEFSNKEQQGLGGYVKEGIPGIYDYILVLDFKSLYPSIMRTFNIDPYSYVKDCKGKNLIKVSNGACFRNENGILPSILTNLYNEREKAKKKKDDLTSYAIKILSNSFYGVLANPSCRFFDINIVNAITHTAQHTIKLTSKKIEEMGYEVIYGDTDSAFVNSNAKSKKEADAIGKKIEKEINEFYKDQIKKEYDRESFLEFVYDKCFIKFLMPKLRGSEKGAKKRYAGLIIKNGKEELQFTGLESVRGDWTDIAKEYQHEILNRVFHNKEITDYTKKLVEDIKKGKYDNKLVYRKNIRKELEDYTKTSPPHVKAARLLKKLDSNKIEYYITENGPEPIQLLKHKIDYEHYIEKQIKPIADSILVFFNTDFDSILKGNKQGSLFDY